MCIRIIARMMSDNVRKLLQHLSIKDLLDTMSMCYVQCVCLICLSCSDNILSGHLTSVLLWNLSFLIILVYFKINKATWYVHIEAMIKGFWPKEASETLVWNKVHDTKSVLWITFVWTTLSYHSPYISLYQVICIICQTREFYAGIT